MIFSAVFVILVIYFRVYEYLGFKGDIIFQTVMGLYICAFSVFFGIFISCIVGEHLPKRLIHIESNEIVGLNSEKQTTGQFFLGSGNVDGELHYNFYQKTGDGRLRLQSVKASETIINEVGGNNGATVNVYVEGLFNPLWRIFAYAEKIKHYEFVVPEGTVQRTAHL